MVSKFSVDNELNDLTCDEYMVKPKSSDLTSYDSDERRLSRLELFHSADELETSRPHARDTSMQTEDEEIDKMSQASSLDVSENRMYESNNETEEKEVSTTSLQSGRDKLRPVSKPKSALKKDQAQQFSSKLDEPHLAEDAEKLSSEDRALQTSSVIYREGGDVQENAFPASGLEIKSLFTTELPTGEKVISDVNATMSNNNKGKDINGESKKSLCSCKNEIMTYVNEFQQRSKNRCSGHEITDHSDAEGVTSEDGESEYNGDPITDYETDGTSYTQDLAHSYFEFSFGEQSIPKYPPSSAFSEELENEEPITSIQKVTFAESQNDLPTEVLLNRAKQAFRPITPFEDSSDLNPSRKMDNLYSYLMHVEKRQIEMSTAWTLIKSCNLNEAQVSTADIKELISSCKKFKDELKIRVNWLLDEVSKLQIQLQRLNPSTDDNKDQRSVLRDTSEKPNSDIVLASLNELQAEVSKIPTKYVQDVKQQIGQLVRENLKPETEQAELKMLCDVKQEEYMSALKAYIDHDFESYKKGRLTPPDPSFRERHTNARLLWEKQKLGDFYFHFLS